MTEQGCSTGVGTAQGCHISSVCSCRGLVDIYRRVVESYLQTEVLEQQGEPPSVYGQGHVHMWVGQGQEVRGLRSGT